MTDRDKSATSSDDHREISLETIPLHSTNLLTVLDETGTIQYESPAIERIYGYEPRELVGRPVEEYFHPDDRERVLEAFQTVVQSETQTVEAVEYRHRRADGSYVWVESVTSTSTTPDGNYIVNSREISEQKQREQTLARKNKQLDRFASVISHDLRNPLTVAGLRLDLASEECNSEHLEDVEQAHDRMERLIEELLTLARSDTKIVETERTALSAFAERCWQNVWTGEAELVVATDQQIRADRSQLEQLVENLFRNAVEHCSTNPDSQTRQDAVEHERDQSETAPVTVTIGDLAGGFYIADNGPGIVNDQRGRVFESGYTTRQNGTGLGLAIVETIAEAHGWEVAITESESGGAQFEITGVDIV